eukprot:TRINITY_DN15553_c0_g1::TRINITY_DN15553_c0_g1_i1::g.28468::m.28468 TRINITY_DN15553_c0_g1::TRINITY_DN15553_c0_g1_i1::g.28468  ORF type:complete len:202 (+),score=11.92 TRINITY_DN15553_c0_g1_i1:112-717(+)
MKIIIFILLFLCSLSCAIHRVTIAPDQGSAGLLIPIEKAIQATNNNVVHIQSINFQGSMITAPGVQFTVPNVDEVTIELPTKSSLLLFVSGFEAQSFASVDGVTLSLSSQTEWSFLTIPLDHIPTPTFHLTLRFQDSSSAPHTVGLAGLHLSESLDGRHDKADETIGHSHASHISPITLLLFLPIIMSLCEFIFPGFNMGL